MIKLNRLQLLFSKLGVLLLAFALVGQVQSTNANFFDTEVSTDNSHLSGALDLVLTPGGPFVPEFMEPETPTTRSINFANNGSLPFDYDQGYVDDGDNPELCENLNLKVTHDLTVVYEGLLIEFAYAHTETLGPGESDDFVYEVTLPDGVGFEYVGLACNFSIKSYAWQPELGAPEVGFWDVEEVASEAASDDWRICTNIHGTKKDEQDNGLEGFEIVVHSADVDPIETLVIDSSNPDPVTSLATLESDKKYLIEVSGVWNNGDTRKVDASYFSDDEWVNRGDFDTDDSRDNKQLDLLLNDQDVDWGGYNDLHLYKLIWDGSGETISFVIYDADQDPEPPRWYEDNAGVLTVKIYDVTDEIYTTDQSGDYGVDVCGLNYQVLEIPKSGWEQMSPTEPDYYHVDLHEYITETDSLDFVNKKLEQSIVINEVYYYVDSEHGVDGGGPQSDEWVELYNPNDFPVNLKDWTLTDDTTQRTISNRNVYIPVRGFAVIAKAAQTWTYWSIPVDAIKIELGQNIGDGLANGGDKVVLKNALGEEVDGMSYGSNNTYWSEDLLSAPEGESLNRIPKGFDTDQDTDWQINPSPNPGTNPHPPDFVELVMEDEVEFLDEVVEEVVEELDCAESCPNVPEVVDEDPNPEEVLGGEPVIDEGLIPEDVIIPEEIEMPEEELE